MIKAQEWLDKEFSKGVKEIELEDKKEFEGQLVVEDYSELENLYLQNVKSINKIVLKNLPQLQECTIWDCSMQDLAIENCPRLKKLNVRKNLLTNLGFLENLECLEELELGGNTELIETLNPYSGDGKNIHKKNKIMNSFLRLFPERELLQELIKAHLEFVRFKTQGMDSPDYGEKCDEYIEKCQKIKKQLRTKLDKGTINEIQRILSDCEKLVEQELELEDKLDSKASLIEGQRSQILQITSDNEKKRLIFGKEEVTKLNNQLIKYETTHQNQVGQRSRSNSVLLEIKLAHSEGKLEAMQEEKDYLRKRSSQQIINFIDGSQQISTGDDIHLSNQTIYQIQYNNQQLQKELTELKQKYQILEPANEIVSDQQKLKKIILFLGAKQIFATTRKNTISNLIDNYNDLDKSGQKFDKMVVLGEYISNTGWVGDFIPASGAGTAVNLLGKSVSAMANFFKSNSLTEHAQKFEDYLMEDEKATLLLNKTYQSLVESMKSNQSKINPIITEILKLNENQFSSHSVFEIGSIKQGEELTVEKMQETINS